MARVFISFVQDDRRVAEAVTALIQHELKLYGQVFMMTNQSQLKAGDDWLKTIHDELTSADIVVTILSKRSITKPWVNFEAGGAWLAGKRVIPVCIGNQQKAGLPPPYSHWQGVNLPDDERYLLSSIADHLGILRPDAFARVMHLAGQPAANEVSGLAKLFESTRDIRFALQHWQDET